jgi:glycosyltransferase involved in cell wall biosynthesis
MQNSTSNNINLAYIAAGNAKDVHEWSGTVFFIAKALERQGINICYIDNIYKTKDVGDWIRFFWKVLYKIYFKITGKKYQGDRTLKSAKKYAKKIEKRLPENIDVIFSTSTITMAFLESNKKKIIYIDATLAAMVNYYPGFSNLCSKTLNEGAIIEKTAFENADLLLFASDWAAQSAIKDYKANPSKVKVIPFGANIEKEYSDTEIMNIIEKRCASLKTQCNLLFIGVDWKRKGGDIVLEIAKQLHSQNINVRLDIVGIKDMVLNLPDYITNHGFISKESEEGRNKLEKLFCSAHFFVLPTQYECFGIVFSESSSFGLPSITTKTGGTETAVKDNINGMTFALSDSPEKYTEYIKTLIINPAEYENLCHSTFNDYKQRLNWKVAGEQILKFIM